MSQEEKFIVTHGEYGHSIIATDNTTYVVPSKGSQNHKMSAADAEECVWLMNYAYEKGLSDKARAFRAELGI